MKEKLLYDMTNSENALKSLSKFLNLGKKELFSFISIRADQNIDYNKIYEELILEFDIDIDKLCIDNIEVKSIHVTTGNDNGCSIREKGLLNLQQSLTQDTTLRKFLLKRIIRIDVESNLIYFKDNKLVLEDNTSDYKDNKNYVYKKLYKDYGINGFIFNNEPLKYEGNVANRPEFIYNLSKILKYGDLEKEWEIENKQCYIVEYKYSHEKLSWINLILNSEDKYEIECNREFYIKLWFIKQAIKVIIYDIMNFEKLEIISYLKLDENIPSQDIINIIDVTEERNNLKLKRLGYF
ncbi:MAG: hypothetical protein SOY42_07870 [Clostridium sp.]|nr:hypothetical protein [Clostridium sp.]